MKVQREYQVELTEEEVTTILRGHFSQTLIPSLAGDYVDCMERVNLHHNIEEETFTYTVTHLTKQE